MSSILNNDNLALLTALTTAKLKTGNLRNQLDQLQTAAHPDQAKIDELNTEIIAAEQYENETLKSLSDALDKTHLSNVPAVVKLPDPILANCQSSGQNSSTNSLTTTTRLAARISPPKEYKHGDDFTIWCTRFRRYLSMSNVSGRGSLDLFLNCVDDRTSQKLDSTVERMTADEKCQPDLFIPICISILYPASESRALRLELTQLSQETDEDIEGFASRIRNIGARAYSDNLSAKDECCLTAFMHGIRNSDIKVDVMKGEANSFEEAVSLATKFERIRASVDIKVADSTDLIDVLRVNNSQQSQQTPVEQPTERSDRDNSQSHYRTPRDSSSYRHNNYQNRNNQYRRPQANTSRNYPNNRGYSNYEETRNCWNCGEQGHLRRFCSQPAQAPLNYQRAGDQSTRFTGRGNQH